MLLSSPVSGCAGCVCAYSTCVGPCTGAICIPVRFIPTLVSFSISAPCVSDLGSTAQFCTGRPLVAGRYGVGGRTVRVKHGPLFQRQLALLFLRHKLCTIGAQWHFGFQHLSNELALRADF